MKTIKSLKAEEIRKSILQLAIQGKLVKQDPNDEPASELVKRIYEEKNRLIKEGKIKKDKNESHIFKGDDNCYYEKIGKNEPVKLEDLPFDIPENWTWIRFGNLVYIQTGASFKKEEAIQEPKENYVRVLRGGNILPFQFLLKSDDLFIPKGLVSDSILLKKNDLITPAVTSLENIGKVAVINRYLTDVTAGGFVYIFRPNCDLEILSNIIMDFMSSALFQKLMKDITKKSGQAFYNMNKERLKDIYFPLPPLNEQKRIVDKIETLEPLLQEYEQYESKLSNLESTFPEKLKKSILQYAIEGKLVKQDPNDEPASAILERIKTEKEALIKAGKIKRDKNESYIYQGDDKNYYENLPNNWILTKLKDVLLPMTSRKPQGDNFRYIDIEAVDNKNNVIRKPKLIKTENAPSRASREVKEGDVLFSIVRPYLKNIAIVTKEFSDCVATTGFYVCRPSKIIKTEFLFYYLLSPMCIDSVMPYMKGDNSPSIRSENLEELLIALPSLEIQKKVCTKVNNLLLKINS